MANYLRSTGYCHVARGYFAHRDGKLKRSTRTYRSLSFHGDTAYSYSTPIARFHTDKQGKTLLLLQEHDYSMTTKGHKSVLRSEATCEVIEVPSIGAYGSTYHGGNSEVIDHEKNLKFMWGQATELQEKAERLWMKNEYDWNIYSWPRRIQEKLGEMLAYQQRLGGDVMKAGNFPRSIPEFISKIRAVREEKERAFNDPKAVERRARAKARRLMKEALNLED